MNVMLGLPQTAGLPCRAPRASSWAGTSSVAPTGSPRARRGPGASPPRVGGAAAGGPAARRLAGPRWLLVADVRGVEVEGAVRPALEAGDVETLIELGEAADGMAAKLRAATAALRAGARAVRIGDLHLLDDARAGTRILAPAVQPA